MFVNIVSCKQLPVRDRGLVPKDHQKEIAYGLSNGHVTDDVTWPCKVKLVTPIRLEYNIQKTAGFKDSVPKDHQQEMLYGLSNSHVTDDITWSQRCCDESVRSAILATARIASCLLNVLTCFVTKFLFQFQFYPRDATLARVFATATCPSVCPSVRLSVCQSDTTGIVSKRRKSWFFHHLVAPRF